MEQLFFCPTRGHVLLIVNIASLCGLTATNYKELVELDEKYRESKGLRILAFPCNQFNGQVSERCRVSLFSLAACQICLGDLKCLPGTLSDLNVVAGAWNFRRHRLLRQEAERPLRPVRKGERERG